MWPGSVASGAPRVARGRSLVRGFSVMRGTPAAVTGATAHGVLSHLPLAASTFSAEKICFYCVTRGSAIGF